jgi:hypothetical protein
MEVMMARKNMFDGPMRKTTVSVPVPVYDAIAELGDGNFSAGIRAVYNFFKAHDNAAPAVASMLERVSVVGSGSLEEGLSKLLAEPS